MRSVRVVFALILFAGTLLHAEAAGAQPRARAFGDLPFGASPATVVATMKELRLEPIGSSATDDPFPLDQRFKGRLKDQDTLVTAVFDPAGSLEKMVVSFLTADEDCVSFFRVLKNELQQKYGAPVTDIERWDFPYDKGGHIGQEHIALRVGKGLLATVWDDLDAGSREGGVVIRTADDVIVEIAYESSKWAAEAARRKQILDDRGDPASAISAPDFGARRTDGARGFD